MNRYYSRRHFSLVSNRGTGNPAPTDAERLGTYRALLEKFEREGHKEAADACRKLIAEIDGAEAR